jgi:hypothetical protein
MGHTKPGKDYFPDYMNVVTRTLNGVITEQIAEQIPAHSSAYTVLVPSISVGIAGMRRQAWRDYERIRRTPEDRHAALEHSLDQRATVVNQAIHILGPAALAAMARTEGLRSLSELRIDTIDWLRPGVTKAVRSVVDLSERLF